MPRCNVAADGLAITFQYQCVYLWRATREYLGNPSYVLWLFDDVRRQIGLRASPAVDGAARVWNDGKVATTCLFQQHGIVVPLGAISVGEPVGDALIFGLPHGPDAVWRVA